MMKTKLCAIPLCDYPQGECYGTCFHPEEIRMDLIGQNGNGGEHYAKTSQNELQDVLSINLISDSGYVANKACKPKEGQS